MNYSLFFSVFFVGIREFRVKREIRFIFVDFFLFGVDERGFFLDFRDVLGSVGV